MALALGTHDGPFHADDVVAASLIRVFVDGDATVLRTRDAEQLEALDVVFDVGGVFDVVRCRFDHHQRDYQGTRSSAGMVLDWLQDEDHLARPVADLLRKELVDYIDAVDVGARSPEQGVPCFSTLVGALVERAEDGDFDRWYERAAEMAADVIRALVIGHQRAERDALAVREAMDDAKSSGRRVLFFDQYLKWKDAYFEAQGADHPTEYVLFPGRGDWRIVTIPVSGDSIRDKRKLPEEWGGLERQALEEIVGVRGARFCHKNLFIAVFDTRDAALRALESWDRLHH